MDPPSAALPPPPDADAERDAERGDAARNAARMPGKMADASRAVSATRSASPRVTLTCQTSPALASSSSSNIVGGRAPVTSKGE